MKNKNTAYLRTLMTGFFNLNAWRQANKKERWRTIGIGVIIGLVILVLAFYLAGTAYAYAKLGLLEQIPNLMFFAANVALIAVTFYKANGCLFACRDQELVTSLPLPTSLIIGSRFLTMYGISLLFSCVMMLPTMIVYAFFAAPPPLFYLFFLITLFVMPLLPMTIAAIISAVITFIAVRFRHANLVTILLSLIIILALVVVPLFLFSDFGNLESQPSDNLQELAPLVTMIDALITTVNQFYPPALWYSQAMVTTSIVSFTLYVVVSFLVFGLFIAVLARFYRRLDNALTARRTKGQFQLQTSSIKARSAWQTLYRREIKRYFTSPLYVLNTLIGPLLLIVFAVAVCFLPLETYLAQTPFAVTPFVPLAMAIILGLTATTTCGISLEGKQVWLLQSLPLTNAVIYNSKLALNLTITLPGVIVGGLLLTYAISFTPLEILALFLFPFTYCIFISEIGLACNLRWPRYDWKEEAAVIKQGLPVLLTMLVDFFLLLLIGVIAFLLDFGQMFAAVYSVLVATLLLAVAAVYLHRRNLQKRF